MHIRLRHAWKAQGHTVEELPFSAAFGEWGSWLGGLFDVLVLIVAVQRTESEHVFLIYLAYCPRYVFPLPPSRCCIR